MEDVFFLDGMVLFLDMSEQSFEAYCKDHDLVPKTDTVLNMDFHTNWAIRQFILDGEEKDSVVYDMYTSLNTEEELHIMFQALQVLDQTQIKTVSNEIFTFISEQTKEEKQD